MDEWVELDNLNLDTVVPPEVDANGKKRRTEEDFSEDEGDHHGISVQRLMEHEEFTKVKNVDRI
jgi:hypothetical protein